MCRMRRICMTVLFGLILGCVYVEGRPSNEASPNAAHEFINVTCQVNTEWSEAICNDVEFEHEGKVVPGSARFFLNLFVILLCVMTAGLMSGLTLGLLGQDTTTLEILAKSGNPEEVKYANRILPLVRKHHLLLVTLLLCNAAAMEALPIFLDQLVPATYAIIISVTAVLFFGEIIPQAICSRWGLAVGGNVYWLVWGVIFVTYPISFPISKVLDFLLGHRQATLFKRNQLKHFVDYHKQSSESEDDAPRPVGADGVPLKFSSSSSSSSSSEDDSGLPPEERLTHDEVLIIKGAIDLRNKTVQDIMTKLDNVAMIDINAVLNREAIKQIAEWGHSRIPVFADARSNIIGMLLAKTLLSLDQTESTPVRSMDIRKIPLVVHDTPLYSMLNMFQTGRSHMAVVLGDQQQAIGVVTLEDIIEELIGEEIEDEMDLWRRDKFIERVRHSRDTRIRKSPQTSPHGPSAYGEVPVIKMRQTHLHPHTHHQHQQKDRPHRSNRQGRRESLGSRGTSYPSLRVQTDPETGLQVIVDEYVAEKQRASLDGPRPALTSSSLSQSPSAPDLSSMAAPTKSSSEKLTRRSDMLDSDIL